MKYNKLDSLLRDWAARHSGDTARREALAESIRRQVACQSVAEESTAPARRKRLHRGMAYAVCGFAAGLLVAVGLFWGWPRWPSPLRTDPGIEVALLSAAEIERSGELFRGMEEVFRGNLRWIAETNGEVSLGLSQGPGTAVSRAAPLVIRTVVLQRKPGESSWHTVFTADVLSRSEELVEIPVGPAVPAGVAAERGAAGPTRLLVWAYRLPDGNVAVDANLRMADSPAAGVGATSVLIPGRAAQVLTTGTTDAEYRVFQAASPLSS